MERHITLRIETTRNETAAGRHRRLTRPLVRDLVTRRVITSAKRFMFALRISQMARGMACLILPFANWSTLALLRACLRSRAAPEPCAAGISRTDSPSGSKLKPSSSRFR